MEVPPELLPLPEAGFKEGKEESPRAVTRNRAAAEAAGQETLWGLFPESEVRLCMVAVAARAVAVSPQAEHSSPGHLVDETTLTLGAAARPEERRPERQAERAHPAELVTQRERAAEAAQAILARAQADAGAMGDFPGVGAAVAEVPRRVPADWAARVAADGSSSQHFSDANRGTKTSLRATMARQ